MNCNFETKNNYIYFYISIKIIKNNSKLKMIYFKDWWSYGDDCILERFNGVLAGDKKIVDICIYKNELMKLFLDSIAKELVIDSGERGQITEKNKEDIFLNKKFDIDFSKQLLFVFSEANIEEIVYSKIFECYLISYSDEPAEANTYTAILVKKIYPGINENILMNSEESDDNATEKEDNKFGKNVKIPEKLMKDFKPKFETMNDKPKPKKGKYLKSYNDDY